MKILVFLGNPGMEYSRTRHNLARMLIDQAPVASALNWQQKFKGAFSRGRIGGEDALLLKPETFMNRSGESVQAAMQFFKADPDALVVIHDEVELDFGVAGFKCGGGLAGHNGLRSIVQQIGTQDFFRFRLGVGRPARGDVASYVLGKFSEEEACLLPTYLGKAWELLETNLPNIEKAERDLAKVRLVEG